MDSSCPCKTTDASTACCLPAGIWLSELLPESPMKLCLNHYNVFLLCSFKFYKFPNKLPWYQFPELVYCHWVRDAYGEWLCAYTLCVHIFMCAHIHVCVHIHACAHMCGYTFVCIYIYMNTHIVGGGWGRLGGSIKRLQGRGTKELQDICNLKAEWGCFCVEGQGHQQGGRRIKDSVRCTQYNTLLSMVIRINLISKYPSETA